MNYGRYTLDPVTVPRVETSHRRIVTPLPVPESVPIFEQMLASEPIAQACQPPVLWDHAEGHSVFDRFGNRWIDWSSCVLVANVGHSHPRIRERLRELIDRGHLATFVFAHEGRLALASKLAEVAPDPLEKVFLMTTGSEACECLIKQMRTWGRRKDPAKRVIVSFDGCFHGRTMGSQLAGGMPAAKEWIGIEDTGFVQVPFPDGYLVEDESFDLFERSLAEQGVDPRTVAGVFAESYLGIGPDFFPAAYVQALRAWCDRHDALLAFDEVQAGFGRSGKMFTFEHYGVAADLISCGKGISSSLPLAAVIGRADVMDQYPPGSMTSTHSASPLSVAAGLASLEILIEDGLVEQSAALGADMLAGCERIASLIPERVGCIRARGMVGGIRIVQPGTGSPARPRRREPDSDLAFAITESCFRKGLLLFSPVGLGGECLKIAPPLSTPRDALLEAFNVLEEAVTEVVGVGAPG